MTLHLIIQQINIQKKILPVSESTVSNLVLPQNPSEAMTIIGSLSVKCV